MGQWFDIEALNRRAIERIVGLIKKEAEKVVNPDPCSRLYNVSMRISSEIIALMEKERESQGKRKHHADI